MRTVSSVEVNLIELGPFIPEISDEELLNLSKKIRPLTNEERGLYFINIHAWGVEELRKISFLWDKKVGGKVRWPLNCKGIIKTYHTFGAPALFKPSIAEVLAQLTSEQKTWCRGFMISPDSVQVLSTGFHLATTHLYGR